MNNITMSRKTDDDAANDLNWDWDEDWVSIKITHQTVMTYSWKSYV